ncbi:MAG: hypothetical protein JXR78_17165 [Victivallales bacterium]|nr:hypothetical protein [Victivallales bacterium]
MNKFNFFTFALIMTLAAAVVTGADKTKDAKEEDQDKKIKELFGGGQQAKDTYRQREKHTRHGQEHGLTDGGQGQTNRFQRYLHRQVSEAEQHKLQELYKKDPEAYEAELKKIAQKLRKQQSKLDANLKKLVEKYHQSTDHEEREKLLVQIRGIIQRQFHFGIYETRRRLQEAENNLAQAKALFSIRRRNSRTIIDKRVEELTSTPTPGKPEK